ncbi:glucose-6-phosphate dehydrogenase assembly protein OpcA [Microlunatus ginsengisoli]|uniref:Glucose-6-phosphate dehydrogenase assembly protein OpcA n=1 Tax=Microlunatus ginsengisoli TaxID=363863 RepID=A0ABP7A926_9ACTN
MIIELENTTSAQISSALVKARRSAGSPAMGMVLTLIIVAEQKEYEAALQASMEAGREHPSRILLVVTGGGRKPTMNAEVRIGEGTPGEVIVVRMSGAIADHPASVIRPLLLPDSPVVIWWPGKCPANPTNDELAQLAGRRLTDAANVTRPLQALTTRAENYLPGDTDLAWTRLTPWRALLAAALDQYPARIKSVAVEAERSNPSADLLAAWLHLRLKLEVIRRTSSGPGITAARLGTAAGDIAITRPDGLLASYAVPGQPERLVALKRRDITELISEEMRRMDSDEEYDRVLKSLLGTRRKAAAQKAARRAPAGVSAAEIADEPGTEVPAPKTTRRRTQKAAASDRQAESTDSASAPAKRVSKRAPGAKAPTKSPAKSPAKSAAQKTAGTKKAAASTSSTRKAATKKAPAKKAAAARKASATAASATKAARSTRTRKQS